MFRPNPGLTKSVMLTDINYVLCQFYGAGTGVSSKVRRLPKADVAKLHEVAYLNRDEPVAEQVKLLESWIDGFVNPQPV